MGGLQEYLLYFRLEVFANKEVATSDATIAKAAATWLTHLRRSFAIPKFTTYRLALPRCCRAINVIESVSIFKSLRTFANKNRAPQIVNLSSHHPSAIHFLVTLEIYT